MSVNFSTVSKIVKTVNNPALPYGTLIEEIPADLGRSAEGYKRGGILEGTEKLRKELMSAAVWMFGIPAFKKAGDIICEKFFNTPMSIDYCKAKEGNNTIKDSVEYLTGKAKETSLDVSDLKKYGDRFKGMDAEALIKKVQIAKKTTSIAAVALNCIAMGIVLPKLNQALTKKKLEKVQAQNTQNAKDNTNFGSIDEFINKNKPKSANNNAISFTGLVDGFVYNVENNNVFRLISTDIPMIGGRAVTSRNKYEALEYVIMDGGSIYFYNFSANQIQKGLRKLTNTPKISPTVAELIQKVDKNTLKEIMSSDLENCSASLEELLKDKKLVDEIYKEATYGRYGKINRFVKNSELKETDKEVVNFLNYIKKQSNDANPIIKDGAVNIDLIKQAIKKTNGKNAAFLTLGLAASIIGLGVIIPKFTFWVTRCLTGKNEFTGLAQYDEDKKSA